MGEAVLKIQADQLLVTAYHSQLGDGGVVRHTSEAAIHATPSQQRVQ
jgi:hypothetical protein